MVIFYFVILIFAIVGIRYKKDGFWNDYIAKDQCNAIKGIFILVVFMRHVVPYITNAGYEMTSAADKLYVVVDTLVGQLLVVMFLFYSGYGIMESVKKKGNAYVASMPRKRLLGTLLNFDVAVCCFALFNLVLGIEFSTQKFALSLAGWESLGNSNWYIFDILVCYALAYIYFLMRPKAGLSWGGQFVLLITLFIVAILILGLLKKEWWYNTLLCFPAGMIYSSRKDLMEKALQQRYWCILVLSGFMFAVLTVLYLLGVYGVAQGYIYNINAMLFAFILVMVTMKFKIQNSVLGWMGLNLFPLYIYQRLPMIALCNIFGEELLCTYPYIYVLACLIITYAITLGFKFWQIKI